MKKSFFFFAVLSALAALAGCQKSEPASGLGDNDAIGFAPYVNRDLTKVAVTDVTASNLSSFNVACYLTGISDQYFKTEQTASKNASGYWSTSEGYLWPTDTNLDFFAYSGSGSSAVSNTGGVAKVSYTVPDAATEDFIVASALNQAKPSASPYAQSLNFSHALSKVSQLTLAPKTGDISANSNYRYVVTDVRIAGAMNSADYTFNPASGSNWGIASGEQDYAFDDKSFNFLGDAPHKLEVGTESKVNDQLIILPQTATFSVTYSVEYSYNGGTTWKEVMPSTTKTTDVVMEMGKAYAIKLQLPVDGTPIVFNVSVSGWDDAEEIDKEVATVFSVSASKKVKFTKGNLYWDGSEYHLESSQTAYPSKRDASHVGHFYWSQADSVAYAMTYNDTSATTSDKFFCGEDNKLTVDGQSGLYALSKDEWVYLLNTGGAEKGARTDANRYAKARVNGVNGLIIFPDEYNGGTAITGVTGVAAVNTNNAPYPSDNVADWSAMEITGCVFLPASGLNSGGSYGFYWSSTHGGTTHAYDMDYRSGSVNPAFWYGRGSCFSIRLVYDIQ